MNCGDIAENPGVLDDDDDDDDDDSLYFKTMSIKAT